MAAFDFPNSPTIGQTANGYTWDGEKWLLTSTTITPPAPATATPLVEGTAAIGASLKYAREDHVHPAGGGGTPSTANPLMNGTAAPGTASPYSREDHVHPIDTTRAPLASPAFTGTPTTAATPTAGDNTTKLATTAFVATAVAGVSGGTGAVRYDTAQSLTSPQQLQARQNIFAAPADAMMAGGMQVNGTMLVNQRVFSSVALTGTGANTKAFDQWLVIASQAGGGLNILAGSAIGSGGPAGIGNDLRMTATAAFTAPTPAQDGIYFRTVVEGWRLNRLCFGIASAAQPFSFGFSFFCPTASAVIATRWFNSAINRFYYVEHPIVSGWNWCTGTVPGDTTGTWITQWGIGIYFDILVWGNETVPAQPGSVTGWVANPAKLKTTGMVNCMGTAGNVVAVSNFVMVPGNQPPPFSAQFTIQRPYDQDLALCQRYYQKSQTSGTRPGTPVSAGTNSLWLYSSSGSYSFSWLLNKMRQNPTITMYDNAGSAGYCSTYGGSWVNGNAMNAGGVTEGSFYINIGYASTQYVNFDFVADASLI